MINCPRLGQRSLVKQELKSLIPCPIGGACQDKTDEQIVSQIKTDKECFIYLMERYQAKIQRYVMKISGIPLEAAQDLTQDIFVKVYTKIDTFDTEQKFSSWIYRIAKNETINYWLYSRRRKTESWDIFRTPHNFIGDGKDLEAEVYQKITNEKLVGSFYNLNEKYREVLALNYLEGKSYREIALELEKPIATIGTLLNRGKKLLKDELLKIGLTSQTASR